MLNAETSERVNGFGDNAILGESLAEVTDGDGDRGPNRGDGLSFAQMSLPGDETIPNIGRFSPMSSHGLLGGRLAGVVDGDEVKDVQGSLRESAAIAWPPGEEIAAGAGQRS